MSLCTRFLQLRFRSGRRQRGPVRRSRTWRARAWRASFRISARAAFATVILFAAHGAAGCSSAETRLPNLALPTDGGNQLWGDLAWDGGWRVQRHVWTGHARLLDDRDVRRAWGSPEACLTQLEQRRASSPQAATDERPLVVLLHGLWRSRDSLAPMKRALEGAGYEVFDPAYPSARRSIDAHAEQLAQALDRVHGSDREIHFVTHSLGALVTRALLAREGDGWRTRHRLGRAVFIAAPHQGAQLARVGARVPGAMLIYGHPARQIVDGYTDTLAAPPLPFMNIAGGHGSCGWNPLIDGDDDGVVAVRETRLAGETDFERVEGLHTFVAKSPEVIELATAFLRGDATGAAMK